MRTPSFLHRLLAALAALVLLSFCGLAAAGQASGSTPPRAAAPGTVRPDATGTALRNGTGLYPRVVRLAHSGSANGQLVAGVVDFDASGGVGVIYRSTDDGVTFQEVGDIHDPATANGLCCSTLFELPRQIGTMPPGTLLWAASVGQTPADRRMSIDVWQSQDHGSTWSQLPPCQTAPNTGGLWEPELSVDSEGDLVCHYSDETNPAAHSQSLEERFSSDGRTWGPVHPTVAPTAQGLRPGMATVIQRADGSYYMTYEVCGTGNQYDCAAHYRTSSDGADWGPPTDIGPMITTETGQYFTHAPTVAWLANGTAAGRLVLVGQQFREANGAPATTSGRTVLVNTENGGGNWFPIDAPVAVPSPDGSYCPNYSSPLLPSADGTRLLEIATDYVGSVCEPFYATGSSQGTQDGADSMTGNLPDLPRLLAVCRERGALMYIDDAHGFGVLGERRPDETSPYGSRGNGIVRHFGESYDNVVLVGGFSKAYSSLLAFLALPTPLKNHLKVAAAPYLYSGPSPTASLATALAGLEVNERRGDALRADLYGKTARVLDQLARLDVGTPSTDGLPIIEVPLADPDDLDDVALFLWEQGIYVTLAPYPLVPRDRVGVRLQITAANTDDDIDRLNGSLAALAGRFALRPRS